MSVSTTPRASPSARSSPTRKTERSRFLESGPGLVLVGSPIRLASGTNWVMLMPHGRRSHTAVDCADLLVSLKRAA